MSETHEPAPIVHEFDKDGRIIPKTPPGAAAPAGVQPHLAPPAPGGIGRPPPPATRPS
jgi:hypothetical protein